MANFINKLFPSGSGIFIRRVRLSFFNVDEKGDPIQPAVIIADSQGRRDDFRISFRIKNNVRAVGSPNESEMHIYNLSKDTVKLLRDNAYAYNLSVGYVNVPKQEESLSGLITLGFGGITNIFTTREEAEYKTTIIGYDGASGLSQSVSTRTAPANAFLTEALQALSEDIPGITLVDTSSADIQNIRLGTKGRVFAGRTPDILHSLAREFGFRWTVKNNKLFIFSDYFDNDGQAFNDIVISAEGGNLLSAKPLVSNVDSATFGLQITSILDPRIFPGSNIQVKSVLNPQIDNFAVDGVNSNSENPTNYSVTLVEHSGDTHSMEFSTQIECLFNDNIITRDNSLFDRETTSGTT